MINSQGLRIDACHFYLCKLIHFKILMSLPTGDLSWYFSKWQFACLEYLCGIERFRIYFQGSVFSGFKYLKIARASRAFSPESHQELYPRALPEESQGTHCCQECAWCYLSSAFSQFTLACNISAVMYKILLTEIYHFNNLSIYCPKLIR